MKPLTLRELEQQESTSVWVKNNTPETMKGVAPGTMYRLSITYGDEYGEKNRITVPSTMIPLDISVYASKDRLLKSASFRNQVINGNLILLSDDDALAERKRLGPVYDREYQRLTRVKPHALEDNELTDQQKEDEDWARILLKLEGDEPAYDEAEVLQRLMMTESEITQDRWKLIVNYTRDDSVKEFALSKLQ